MFRQLRAGEAIKEQSVEKITACPLYRWAAILQIFPEVLADFRMLQSHLTAAWIIPSLLPMSYRLRCSPQRSYLGSRHGAHSVGELDFSACAGSGVVQNVENIRRQHAAPQNRVKGHDFILRGAFRSYLCIWKRLSRIFSTLRELYFVMASSETCLTPRTPMPNSS